MSEKSTTPGRLYSCAECGGCDCKLWRPAYAAVELTCWACLEAKGYRVKYGRGRGTDQVYDEKISGTSWVPAVPDLDGSWWGYSSVPAWWVAWWKALPNRKDTCTMCCGSGNLTTSIACPVCSGSGRRPTYPAVDQRKVVFNNRAI